MKGMEVTVCGLAYMQYNTLHSIQDKDLLL